MTPRYHTPLTLLASTTRGGTDNDLNAVVMYTAHIQIGYTPFTCMRKIIVSLSDYVSTCSCMDTSIRAPTFSSERQALPRYNAFVYVHKVFFFLFFFLGVCMCNTSGARLDHVDTFLSIKQVNNTIPGIYTQLTVFFLFFTFLSRLRLIAALFLFFTFLSHLRLLFFLLFLFVALVEIFFLFASAAGFASP